MKSSDPPGPKKEKVTLVALCLASLLLAVPMAQANRVVVIPMGGKTVIEASIYWVGEWGDNVSYKPGDGIQHEGSSYLCRQEHTSSAASSPPNTEYWELMAKKGDTGETGAAGPQGVKGDAGAVGPQGLKGDTGDTGPAGPKGDFGLTGLKGDTGEAGPAGPKGDTGEAGNHANERLCPAGQQVTGIIDGEVECSGDVELVTFITEGLYTLNQFGSLAEADALCQVEADTAELEGQFMAWLSDDTASVASRIPYGSTNPYVRPGGLTVAEDWVDLTDGSIAIRNKMTAAGDIITANFFVWTGTDYDGTATADNCNNWSVDETGTYTATVGQSGQLTSLWTKDRSLGCGASLARRFYCLQANLGASLQGAKGDTGDVGPAGPQGEQGLKGDTGEQGIQGPKGDTGATGPAGSIGGPVLCEDFPLVHSDTGRIWMACNLGATQVATAIDDPLAYGDLYQWGRGTDGHEKRDSATTDVYSTTDDPGHGDFIHSGLADWRYPSNSDLWQGVDGINNPCPDGFRIPTRTEWSAEKIQYDPLAMEDLFHSPLDIISILYPLELDLLPRAKFQPQVV